MNLRSFCWLLLTLTFLTGCVSNERQGDDRSECTQLVIGIIREPYGGDEVLHFANVTVLQAGGLRNDQRALGSLKVGFPSYEDEPPVNETCAFLLERLGSKDVDYYEAVAWWKCGNQQRRPEPQDGDSDR